jgi:pyridoxal phosphate enzyme (YggS family)
MSIGENYRRIREEVPEGVTIIAAAKTRTPEEIRELIDAGIADIGENYVQEAEDMHEALGRYAENIRWHLIGHLQRNKVNKALQIFSMIQTLDSLRLARAIDKRSQAPVPVLVEINSGREPQKTGVLPEEAERFIREISPLERISVRGLMTMGPRFGDPEEARPYFRETKKIFDHIASLDIPNTEMKILSMGMSNAYRIAVEEGSTMIRPGTVLFGERKS